MVVFGFFNWVRLIFGRSSVFLLISIIFPTSMYSAIFLAIFSNLFFNVPYITNKGRKGGSPCASAIVNALFNLVREGLSS